MPPRHTAPPHQRTVRHARRLRRHPIARGIALTTVAVVAFGVTAGGAAYARFQGNVDVVDVSALVGPAPSPSVAVTPDPTDPNAGQARNILLLGSDERDGENGEIGGVVEGMRSDTTIVVHISADRTRAELVSIPRDSLVDIPSCTMSDGSTSRAQSDAMFNSAFATGWDQGGDMVSAASCTIKTVQENTGLTIDEFAVVDFAGFTRMVDALGGVPICIAEDYASPDAGLYVSAGYQTLDGATALAFARARKGTNMNGSDLQRAGRQQELIAAMIRQIMAQNLLTDVPGLLGFLDAATSSLTVSPGIGSLTDMAGLALSLRGIQQSNITFMTIPVATAPQDKNRVVWTSAADTVWANMAADTPIVPSTATATPTTDATATAGATAGATTGTTPATTPTPVETAVPGVDPFSPDDVTAVCG
ncbi:MAG: LCP family protein [Cellulomonadaceae bacterium]|nr:LCP family protein [Cellulomonadaceae bacterium]